MAEDLTEKYRTLVDRLYKKTQQDGLSWQITPTRELVCSMNSYAVCLRSTRDADGEPFEFIEIRNNSEDVIDVFTDGALSGTTPHDRTFSNYYEKMVALRSSARRKALGADKAINEILQNLDDDDDDL